MPSFDSSSALRMGSTLAASPGWMRMRRGSGVVIAAISLRRIWVPYASTRMLVTRSGEALPVRMPANSAVITSVLLIIFSSASRRISSRAIRQVKGRQAKGNSCGSCGRQYFETAFLAAASLLHQLRIRLAPRIGYALRAAAGKLDGDHGLRAAGEDELGRPGGTNLEAHVHADFFHAHELRVDGQRVGE